MFREPYLTTFEINGHVYKIGQIIDHRVLGRLFVTKIYRSKNQKPWDGPYITTKDEAGVEHNFLPEILLSYMKGVSQDEL